MRTALGPRIGTTRTITYHVGDDTMVARLLPEVPEFVRKPAVMATGWLVGVCEWPAMEALRDCMSDAECSLGTGVRLSHLAPVPPGATLTVTARCVQVTRSFSDWAVTATDGEELVAAGSVSFVVVNQDQFVRRRLTPKLTRLMPAVG